MRLNGKEKQHLMNRQTLKMVTWRKNEILNLQARCFVRGIGCLEAPMVIAFPFLSS